MITENRHTQNDIVIEQQFAQIDAIINSHRNRAIANVNVENLLTYWEIGQYISYQLQHSLWGSKVVGDLADYLNVHNPKQRGFGKRHLYNMVKFFDVYSTGGFELLISKLPLNGIVQLPIAQLEMGKDFLFMESEYPIVVGGKNRRVDLLFYHRALQCLVAVELKKDDFEPEFVGKMDMYLEALDRDVKRSYENPTIGIILCPSADRVSVEYTLSRSLSPTMVAEYRRLLIPQETMTKSLEEYCAYLKDDINKTK